MLESIFGVIFPLSAYFLMVLTEILPVVEQLWKKSFTILAHGFNVIKPFLAK
jgi:hypothetical protein